MPDEDSWAWIKRSRALPEWQEARDRWVADYPDLTPSDALASRLEAINDMYLIDCRMKESR